MGWGRGEPGQGGNQQHASGVEHGADAEAVGKDPAEEEVPTVIFSAQDAET